MPRRAFRVAYDGRPFHGFQRQPDVPTVEGTLFDALRALDLLAPDAAKPDGYAAAGRTDAGVSAAAQTVAFDCPDWCSPRALNSELPGSVRAWAAADAPAGFHATHDADRREYAYHLCAPDLDDDRARGALSALSGEHDFHNLTADDRDTVRALDADAAREGEFLRIRVAAGGFPRELVRRLVSLVRAIGAGEADRAKVERVLGPAPLDGPEGVPAAPAPPLALTDVRYDGLSFTTDGEAAESARRAFEERRVSGLVAARVAAAVRDRTAR